jgi:hypothetical protein
MELPIRRKPGTVSLEALIDRIEALEAGLTAVSPGIASPLDLTGCALWLDASQITGLSDGDAVATWQDLSGNAYHATQATSDNRPTYKTDVQNGLSVVRFDPASDPQFLGLSGAGLDLFKGIDAVSVFVVLTGFGVQSGSILTASANGDTAVMRFWFGVNGAEVNLGYSTDDGVDGGQAIVGPQPEALMPESNQFTVVGGVAIPTIGDGLVTSSRLMSTYTSAGGSTANFGGTQGPLANTTSDAILIGGGSISTLGAVGYTGDMGEIVVYNRALTLAERRKVIEYLSTKWGTL